MKIGGLRASKYGTPAYMKDEDEHEFVLGSGTELARGCVFREVRQQDQWQLANMAYGRGGGALIVSDHRGKDFSYRVWKVTPTEDRPGRGVVLEPLHEEGSFFRGGKAHSVEPLTMSSSLKTTIACISGQETFNRVSIAMLAKKGLADVSRTMSLFHGFGFVEPDGRTTEYAQDDPSLSVLKNDMERWAAQGVKKSYRKTERWDSCLVPQFAKFLESRAKSEEVDPSWSAPTQSEPDGGDSLIGPVGGVVLDQEPEDADGDLGAGVSAGLTRDALAVDEGPVQAPEVPDQDVLP